MNKNKLSPAQQTLVSLLQGKAMTYKIGKGAKGTRSMIDKKIDGKKPEQRISLSTVEALINRGHVIKSVDNNTYTVVLASETPVTDKTAYDAALEAVVKARDAAVAATEALDAAREAYKACKDVATKTTLEEAKARAEAANSAFDAAWEEGEALEEY